MHSVPITIPGAPHNFTLTYIHSQLSSFAYSTKLTHQSTQLIILWVNKSQRPFFPKPWQRIVDQKSTAKSFRIFTTIFTENKASVIEYECRTFHPCKIVAHEEKTKIKDNQNKDEEDKQYIRENILISTSDKTRNEKGITIARANLLPGSPPP